MLRHHPRVDRRREHEQDERAVDRRADPPADHEGVAAMRMTRALAIIFAPLISGATIGATSRRSIAPCSCSRSRRGAGPIRINGQHGDPVDLGHRGAGSNSSRSTRRQRRGRRGCIPTAEAYGRKVEKLPGPRSSRMAAARRKLIRGPSLSSRSRLCRETGGFGSRFAGSWRRSRGFRECADERAPGRRGFWPSE